MAPPDDTATPLAFADDRSGRGASGSTDRYSQGAMILHWAIAALILFNLAVGFFMEGFPAPWRALTVKLHISSGITVLALTALRVIWRLLNTPPPHPAGMKSWERHAAHFVHLFLYGAMVLMPLTGWAIVSAHPREGTPGAAYAALHPMPGPGPGAPPQPKAAKAPPRGGSKIWFVLPLPAIAPIEKIGEQPGGVPAQAALHEDFVAWHRLGGFLLLALLALHLAGALKHQFLDGQPELQRMGLRWFRPARR